MNDPAAVQAAPAGEAASAPPAPAAAPATAAEQGDARKAPPSRRNRDRGETPGKLDAGRRQTQYNFYGNSFQETTFGGAQAAERRVTWATALSRLERSDCPCDGEEADPVFDTACARWSAHRIIVLRHHPQAQDRAERLLYRLAHWASGLDPVLKLMGTANDAVLPLGDLAADEAWPADSHGALVQLHRRQDQKTTLFLSSINTVGVKALCERLQARNARLLISVAAEWDAGEGRCNPFHAAVGTLEVMAERPRAAAPVVADESPFHAVPRIAASLFEGLGAQEFAALVDELLVGVVPPATPAPAAAGTATPAAAGTAAAPAPPPPPPPTLHQRWLAGDVDRVLAELGVRYAVASTELAALPGGARSAGYGLADPASPYAEPGWVIAHHPALLARRTDALLDRYLADDTASARYREAFRVMLARLDAASVRKADADWLSAAWRRALARQVDPAALGERLYALAEHLTSDQPEPEPVLARALVDMLADDVIAADLQFQAEMGAPALHDALATGGADPADAEPSDVWQLLRATPRGAEAMQRLEYRQVTSTWALLLMARRWPRLVALALARVLDECIAAGSPWRQIEHDLPVLKRLPRHAPLTLRYLLALAAQGAPAEWARIAGAVVQACEADVLAALKPADARRRRPAAELQRATLGQRLAFLCLDTLAAQLDADAPERCVLRRLELWAAADERPVGDAALVGRLLAMAQLPVPEEPALGAAGGGQLMPSDVVRFLRALMLDLQADEALAPADAASALARTAAGLRAGLALPQRRAIVHHVRESLAAQQHTRDEFEAEGDRDMVRLMRRRIRATQAVFRSLSAGS